jgi:hypothetical protein
MEEEKQEKLSSFTLHTECEEKQETEKQYFWRFEGG